MTSVTLYLNNTLEPKVTVQVRVTVGLVPPGR